VCKWCSTVMQILSFIMVNSNHQTIDMAVMSRSIILILLSATVETLAVYNRCQE